MQRVCILVDGENFRHNIVDLFENFSREDYLPKLADWQGFFDWVVRSVATEQSVRVRTYWYVVEHVDFLPYRFPHPERDPSALERLLRRSAQIRPLLNNVGEEEKLKVMREQVERLQRHRDAMQRRFEGWRRIQHAIATRHEAIEFRRAGAILYDLFNRTFGSEKAVDVKLAIDLLMLRDIYDMVIIVSGDQDYVPAVQVVKDFGKRVVNIAFETRGGKLLPGGAWRLNQITDRMHRIPHGDLARFLKIEQIQRASPSVRYPNDRVFPVQDTPPRGRQVP
jgi:uncharacterized LabA/DUF88 family protein